MIQNVTHFFLKRVKTNYVGNFEKSSGKSCVYGRTGRKKSEEVASLLKIHLPARGKQVEMMSLEGPLRL